MRSIDANPTVILLYELHTSRQATDWHYSRFAREGYGYSEGLGLVLGLDMCKSRLAPYRSLAEAVKGFLQIGQLYVGFLNFWDNSDGIEATVPNILHAGMPYVDHCYILRTGTLA